MSNDEWRTPLWLFQWLSSRFNFKLDVAATKENSLCEKFCTPEMDALTLPWFVGPYEWIWINPPYSDVTTWVLKAAHEMKVHQHQCLMLLPVRSDQKWWHFAMRYATAIEFYEGRIEFLDPTGKDRSAPREASCNVIFGPMSTPIIRSINVQEIKKQWEVKAARLDTLTELQADAQKNDMGY